MGTTEESQNAPSEKNDNVTPATAERPENEVEIATEVQATKKDTDKEAIKNDFMLEMQRKFSQSELVEDHGVSTRYHIVLVQKLNLYCF